MRTALRKLLVSLPVVLAILLAAGLAQAAETASLFSTKPGLHNGKKWRIAYCETGPYGNYAGTLYYLAQSLADMGWIRNASGLPYEWGQVDTSQMWQWLVKNGTSEYLEFVADGYYSLKLGKEQEEAALRRVKELKDVDLVIVMGTVAGKLMATDDHATPTLVFSTSNAVGSGIVKGVETSGRKHIWAHMFPSRYTQQVRVFHDIFKFKRLGIVYEDSPNARNFAAVADVESVARERGFEIVRLFITGTKDKTEQDRFFNDLLAAHQKIAPQVDAFYYSVSPLPGLDVLRLSEALAPFYQRKIPVFSQLGEEEVRRGALMSLARPNFSGMGSFGADVIAKVFNGASPGDLPQVYEDTPAIALNLEVAEGIGFRPPFDILLVADKVYANTERN